MKLRSFTSLGLPLSFALALASLHCSSDPSSVTITPDAGADVAVDAAASPAPKTMAELFQSLAPKPKSFTITAESGGSVKGDHVSFDVPAGAIFDLSAAVKTADLDDDGKLDSAPVQGPVRLELREFATAGDMVRGNLPTQTASGEWLESGGSFELRAWVGTKEVRVARLEKVSFKGAPVSSGAGAMELWLQPRSDDGGWQRPVAAPPAPLAKCNTEGACAKDQACFNQASCRPILCVAQQGGNPCGFDVCLGTDVCPIKPQCQLANACKDDPQCTKTADCRVKCKGHCDTDECKAVPICQPAPIAATGTNPDYFFNGSPFGNIGGHNAANCDAISHLASDHLTMFVRFASNYSTESGVFFIPTGENTAAKLYTKIVGAPPGQEGNKSYDLSMPIGVSGKLVVVALKDGKYFYEERAVTIADDGSAGAKSQTLMVNPAEVSESVFNAKMSAL